MNNPQTKTANQVLDEVYSGNPTQDFIDPYRIARYYNIQIIEEKSLSDEIIGEITCDEDVVKIKLNPLNTQYEPRKNFTIAHELGHYFMHFENSCREFIDNKKTMNRTASFWDRKESEANDFAANLLMPVSLILTNSKHIIDEYKKENGSNHMPENEFIDQLSRTLKVSRESLTFRLKNIGVIK
ncbi:hypothetical protein A6M27_11545 [Acidithiobacillus thiooxidans]|uniref:IrrE N-terminal-like domain-containing protein n=1 Tax=Acidithiobacillus thiooxidans TaxID=930 RepID=A0A1C2ITS8_ACITH|nr:ImmA/IrrE family metallo-endopeptidase [Acidithiobacillus thiooxidans]OCX67546.1 hypothetical protein A6P07_19635 [Acidithiobacillus thiooxidans]OCX78141.1 hypothetical protein A6O26_18490 [Acidithiobacillus thiooxidans]OCX79451.1 hypothetical protein A6O24_01770 [Acidithiobacillus thiooxidans]OCX86802.1 hypothetical protein A6M27_11545 [Acidithiobacillus thiooxidans]OFC48612.1 hypothetical protein BAE47_07025 [Acidithiobacillus thiooxidans]